MGSSGSAGQQASSEGGAPNTAGSSSGGATSTTGGAGASGGEGACIGEACSLAVNPVPLWATRLKSYGRGPASIRFSSTDTLVYVGAGLNYFNTPIDRFTGEVAGDPNLDRSFIASDPSGRWVVRRLEKDCGAFADESQSPAFHFECYLSEWIQFSADGSALARHSCLSEPDHLLGLEVYDTESGARIAKTTANLPCLNGGDDWNVLVDSQHRRTLFAHPLESDLYVFDWATQSVTHQPVHEPSPRSRQPLNHEGTILTLSLSHDGQKLVSIGAADGLAFHDAETLTVELRVPGVPFFNLFDSCYCAYLSESPVAWSPADEIYATAHSSGGIELRSVATQKTLGVLEPPSDPESIKAALSSGYGPVLIQFAPDLRHLVALYPQYAVGYSLSP